jgi:hypothetical protein
MADPSRARRNSCDPWDTWMGGGNVRRGAPGRSLRPQSSATRRAAGAASAPALSRSSRYRSDGPPTRRPTIASEPMFETPARVPHTPMHPSTNAPQGVPSRATTTSMKSNTAWQRPGPQSLRERIALLVDRARVEGRPPAEGICSHGHVTVPRDVRVPTLLDRPASVLGAHVDDGDLAGAADVHSRKIGLRDFGGSDHHRLAPGLPLVP